jgi:hypothetical protein
MMGLIDARISIQSWVRHDSVDKIIDDGSNVIDAAESVIE